MTDPAAAVILLVDTDPAALAMLRAPLERAGYLCVTATSFTDARTLLIDFSPDVLIAAIRLGAFNGLQLALQRSLNDQPSIVTDVIDDPALRREAALLKTPYVSSTIRADELLRVVDDTLRKQTGDERRRWHRAGLRRPVTATVEGMAAQVVDASYGGCQLVMTEAPSIGLPPRVTLSIPDGSLLMRSQLVWRAPSGGHAIGLALLERTVPAISSWRRWVDRVAA